VNSGNAEVFFVNNFELSSSGPRRARLIIEPVEVEARLHELHPDLTSALLRAAVIGGLGARNDVTRASAPTAAGVQQWLTTVEDLRKILAKLQWKIHEHQNCPFISSPEHEVSVVVMTGNSETGKEGFDDPTNQAEKGAVAEGYVQRNFNQLELFNDSALKLAKSKARETQVWALLYHYDKKLKQLRFELSLPTGFSRKKITQWGERLIFGAVPNSPDEFTITKEEPGAPATVEVVPKKGAF